MKIRAIITTIVSFLLLVAVVAAGLNIVFTVTLVDARFTLLSDAGDREADELREKFDGYLGKSTTFLDLSDLEAEVAAYPCLRLVSAEKKYPSTIEVRVEERREMFAVRGEDGYSVYDDTGVFLYRGENTNRTGGSNIELVGFGEIDAPSDLSVQALFTLYGILESRLGEPRANILSITYETHGGIDRLLLDTREGMRIVIWDPASALTEKCEAAIAGESGYLSRPVEQRVHGTLTVDFDETTSTVITDYRAD